MPLPAMRNSAVDDEACTERRFPVARGYFNREPPGAFVLRQAQAR